jgi:hypothetical protein
MFYLKTELCTGARQGGERRERHRGAAVVSVGVVVDVGLGVVVAVAAREEYRELHHRAGAVVAVAGSS